MYCKSDIVADLEDMLMDFLVYRKSKQIPQMNIQSTHQIGKGWPHYKEMQALPLPELDMQEGRTLDIEVEQAITSVMPKPLLDRDDEDDIEFMKRLHTDIDAKLEPYVERVLSNSQYDGSPIYEEHFSKESLARLVDQVLELAARDLDEVDDIMNDLSRGQWNRHYMLKAIVEGLVLKDLYWRRKFSRKGYAGYL